MSVSFNRLAGIFDRTRRIPCDVKGKIIETLAEELGGCQLILDVGVGTGRFAQPLKEAGFKVFGIDISEKMLKKAYEKKLENLVLGDACKLPFKDSTFDSSVCVSMLHLIKEWKTALREMVRVTKESLFTVVQPPISIETTPSHVYQKLLKKYEYSYSHPGVPLWKLKDVLKPTKSCYVTSYLGNTLERISFIDEKVFSFQCKVPQETHRKAMRELKRMFAENKQFIVDVYVYKWDVKEIEKRLGYNLFI